MKLLPIPGAPGYRIDCENHQVYSVKNGVIKLMRPSRQFNEVHLYLNGMSIARSVARLELCATMGISIFKLTKDMCVVYEGGKPVVKTRAEIQGKGVRTRMSMKPDVEAVERSVSAIKEYRNGNKAPYVLLCHEEAQRAIEYIVERYKRKSVILEDAADKAVSNLLSFASEGKCVVDPFRYVRKYIYGTLETNRKRRKEYRDDMNVMEI